MELNRLKRLDVSSCTTVNDIRYLIAIPSLTWLNLSQLPWIETLLPLSVSWVIALA